MSVRRQALPKVVSLYMIAKSAEMEMRVSSLERDHQQSNTHRECGGSAHGYNSTLSLNIVSSISRASAKMERLLALVW